jgi:hypothetical protein
MPTTVYLGAYTSQDERTIPDQKITNALIPRHNKLTKITTLKRRVMLRKNLGVVGKYDETDGRRERYVLR